MATPFSFVSAEKTYLIRQSDSSEREYRLYELTWLWRTAALPHDAVYRDDGGQWRPVRELVEPLLQKEREKTSKSSPPESRHAGHAHRWMWAAAIGAVLAVALALGSEWWRQYTAWKVAQAAEREALQRERSARTEDFIQSNEIVLGMTPEEVRRAIGPPRTVKATGDASLERWFYRKQILVFENGKVIGVEATR